MAQNTAEIEMWACVNAEGEYAVATEEEAAREAYENDVGPLNEAGGFRMVKVTVKVPLAEVIELEAEVPADGEAVLTLK